MTTCKCSDPGCPVHEGASVCTHDARNGETLYRIDMHDNTGTRFCDACASDAYNSGLFAADFPDDYEFDEADIA